MKIPPELELGHAEVTHLTDGPTILGYECFLFRKDDSKVAFSGGFGNSESLAKQIAIAEAIERHLLENLSKASADTQSNWGIDRNSSSSGFAFSSLPVPASQRSICEAYEHFVRYHGLNQGRLLEAVTLNVDNSDSSTLIAKNFDELRWHHKTDSVSIGDHQEKLTCLILTARQDNGFFIGAKASLQADLNQLTEHCLIEAWRNFRIAKAAANLPDAQKSRTRRRTEYFSNQWEKTVLKLNQNPSPWPIPEVVVYRTEKFESVDGYLSRALMADIPQSSEIGFDELA